MTNARAALLILVLALVWGCNWPVLKMGVTELAPLTFRGITLPLAAGCMLVVARLAGDSIRMPRAVWPRLGVLALFNITGWNGFLLFGVQQLPAGRSAILAYTMPIWATIDPQPLATELAHLSDRGWFSVVYNIFFAGALANLAWFMLARTMPVAASSLSSLPIPVVGVISGIVLLGERPGAQEWIALGLVVAALFTVLFEPSAARITATPRPPD